MYRNLRSIQCNYKTYCHTVARVLHTSFECHIIPFCAAQLETKLTNYRSHFIMATSSSEDNHSRYKGPTSLYIEGFVVKTYFFTLNLSVPGRFMVIGAHMVQRLLLKMATNAIYMALLL